MSDKGRSPSRLLVIALALPIFALVYVTTFGSRLWAALRPTVATFLGATVIGSVYAEEAYRRTPTPMRAAAVMALSVALVMPSFATPQRVSAADPAEAVIAAARDYLGANFRLGTEGPRTFDCSGLIYRAFSDAGELPRIGGMRLRAAGYMQYFVSRGRFTKDESEARRGDLVVYDRGSHIGIYLGDNKVISALVQPWGVTVHSMYGIHLPVTYILHVNWGGGDADNNNGGNNGNEPPKPDKPDKSDKGAPGDKNGNDSGQIQDGSGNADGDTTGKPDANNGNGENVKPDANNGNGENVKPDRQNAVALGTVNIRIAADPNARIIGWIGRNGQFNVIAEGTSPGGYPWYQIRTKAGKEGWVYARWIRQLN